MIQDKLYPVFISQEEDEFEVPTPEEGAPKEDDTPEEEEEEEEKEGTPEEPEFTEQDSEV